ncbi:HD domain-containing protein [Sphingomonas swuensis]
MTNTDDHSKRAADGIAITEVTASDASSGARANPALVTILDAADFAAHKHRNQRRKGAEASPYINHPLALARTLASAGITETTVLCAALLHDAVEDTETSFGELEERFGQQIASIVREVTDDKSILKSERKRLQVETAPKKSREAKLVKLADKISNLRDILSDPPTDWPTERKLDYFEWAGKVVHGCRGTHAELETEFDALLAAGRQKFGGAIA